jgi:hypothetical protein
LLLFALWGLFLTACVFTVALANMLQRWSMRAEMRRYMRLLELANKNMEAMSANGQQGIDVFTGTAEHHLVK